MSEYGEGWTSWPPGVSDRPQGAGAPTRIEEYGGVDRLLTRVTTLGYDDVGRLSEVAQRGPGSDAPPLEARRLRRDESGRLVRVEVERRPAASEPWEAQTLLYHYDPDGRPLVEETRDDRGDVILRQILTWAWGHPVARRVEDGAGALLEETRWQWRCGALGAREHRAAIDDEPLWTAALEWDGCGRLRREVHSRDGATDYEYDDRGRLSVRTRRGPSDGAILERARLWWDDEGRLVREEIERHGWPRAEQVELRYSY